MRRSLSIRLPGWMMVVFANPEKDNKRDKDQDSSKYKIELLSIYDLFNYVSRSLLYMADKNVISSCQIHREFGKLKRPYQKTKRYDRDVYFKFLWEGAEKVVETARHISTNPNYRIDSDIRSEIKVLSESFADLGRFCMDQPIGVLRKKISTERDFIKFIISTRTKGMKHEHFSDGTLSYTYLTLLFYLYSFLNSTSRLDVFKV